MAFTATGSIYSSTSTSATAPGMPDRPGAEGRTLAGSPDVVFMGPGDAAAGAGSRQTPVRGERATPPAWPEEDAVPDRPRGPRGIALAAPGAKRLGLAHVVFDFNGTLATDGALIRGVAARIRRLARVAEVVVLTADTFGTARAALAGLPVAVRVVRTGRDKRRLVRSLGGEGVAVVGNGANDVPMFEEAALGIAVCGTEGMAAELARAATVVVGDVNHAIDLLLRPKRLVATLRR